MRAALWIAASGFLFASGAAYASTEPSTGYQPTVDADTSAESPAAPVDLTITNQGPQRPAYDVSKTQPVAPDPRDAGGARSYPVTIDLDHPGGEFPSGG